MSKASLLGSVSDPIVQGGIIVLLGVILGATALRAAPAWRLIVHTVYFTLLTGILFAHDVVPFAVGYPDILPQHRAFFGLAKIVWWLSLALSLISCVRVFVILEQRPREGRLIQDLIVGAIYVGAFLSITAYVFSAPIGTLIATSGVLAVIFGLALQSTLGDVFSGIALNIGRPYRIGDWIVLRDGTEGRVMETNWRATHLLNAWNDLVVIPNSDLAKARLTNMSTPERSHGAKVTVRLRPTAAPSMLADVMQAALLSSNTILPEPVPAVQVKSMDVTAIELDLSFSVADLTLTAKAQSEIFDLVFRHSVAAGLQLAPPPGVPASSVAVPQLDATAAAKRSIARQILDALPLFATLTDEEKKTLADAMALRTYQKDEIIVQQGHVIESLMVIRSGVVSIMRRQNVGETELVRLAPGDCFGHSGMLAGLGEPGTIRALTTVMVYEIGKSAFAALLHERPLLADELGVVLGRRAEVNRGSNLGYAITASGSVPSLIARIRTLFDV